MVSVIDQVEDGISAVYTFFDPARQQDSLGVYGVLWQIELAKRLALPYLYLGYWIADSRKMAYKMQYSPLEGLVDGRWQVLDA
jgi:arginine-tRNA-protein transferase